MASTNVGDAIALVFEAIAGISVTAEIIDPHGTVGTPVPVAPDGTDPDTYPFTFIPTTVGIWRVRFRGSGQAVASETYTVEVTDTSSGPAPYATAASIATMWRPLSTEEATRADTLARYASAMMRTAVPTLDVRIDAGILNPDVALLVCVQMVLRVLRNPSGVAAETVGPWSVTYGSTGTEASGRLVLTADDLALLTGTAAGARRGTARCVHSPAGYSTNGHPRAWSAET